MTHRNISALALLGGLLFNFGCSSAQPVKSQAYARLSNERTLESEFPVVWKGIEAAFREYKVVERNPSEVDELEMKKLKTRTLETDWIYGQSRDKYAEYKVNGSPRKKYLQTRFRYKVDARSQIGGTDVKIRIDEEIERLNTDGSTAGYESSGQPDPTRGHEMLDRVQNAILSAAP